MTTIKKITLSTVKSFVRKNQGNIFINVASSFDGSTDCCESRSAGFVPAVMTDWAAQIMSATMGIQGAWFVGGSRDYFRPYDENGMLGIEVYNSCGRFILAIKK